MAEPAEAMKGDKVHSYRSPPSDFEYISATPIDHITRVLLHPPLGYNLEPDVRFEEWIIPRLEVAMADQRPSSSVTNIIIVRPHQRLDRRPRSLGSSTAAERTAH